MICVSNETRCKGDARHGHECERTNAMTTNFATGQRVNVTVKGEQFIAEVVKQYKNGKVRVEFDDGTKTNVSPSEITERKRGRKSIVESMSPAELKAHIDGLLNELESCETQDEAKKIRAKLRRAGHKGGASGEDTVTVKSINA